MPPVVPEASALELSACGAEGLCGSESGPAKAIHSRPSMCPEVPYSSGSARQAVAPHAAASCKKSGGVGSWPRSCHMGAYGKG